MTETFGSANLQAKCDAFRRAAANVLAADARAGPWPHRPPPGPGFTRALGRFIKASEDLFSSPAMCADDVLRKYAMFEEFHYRDFSEKDAHWYGQMDADMERFGVDIHPWWRPDCSPDLKINGREVEWRNGQWHIAPFQA